MAHVRKVGREVSLDQPGHRTSAEATLLPAEVVVMANHTKFGLVAQMSIVPLKQINILVTNQKLPEDFQNELVGATQLPHMRDEFPFLKQSLGTA